jgi:hypothetical protein
MPYFDDLVMSEIISYCGLKQAEDKLTPGVYVFMERVEYPVYVRGTINNQLYLISRGPKNTRGCRTITLGLVGLNHNA